MGKVKEKLEWYISSKDEDCKVMEYACRDVNKKFSLASYSNFLNKGFHHVECDSDLNFKGPFEIQAYCINSQCIRENKNKAWYICEQDSDCVLIPLRCDDPISVNHKFKEEAQRYADELARGSLFKCEQVDIDDFRQMCLKNFCQIKKL